MRKKIVKKKKCYFCENKLDINYKDTELLSKFISGYCKILPPRKFGTCAKHQRKLAKEVKRARFMALLPYTRY